MSKAAQLKRKAAELEQKRQYDRALAAYVQAIDAASGSPEELDIPLYNRVGDLHLRLGELDRAIPYYEKAVDLYAEGGFFNNAIALCNKVLRHAPGRAGIYYKLGKISARKGFNSDAKQNFLEYASRMERGGDITEAFRALKEFADLCPGQDDVRLMLAEQLARAGRNDEALEQLQVVYEAMVADDRGAEATATLERIRAIDPAFQPRTERAQRPERREGLVFIDVDGPDAIPEPLPQEAAPAVPVRTISEAARAPHPNAVESDSEPSESEEVDDAAAPHPLSPASFARVELPTPAEPHAARTLDNTPLAGLTPLEDPMTQLAASAGDHALAEGIEHTAVGAGYDSADLATLTPLTPLTPLELEPTSFGAPTGAHVDDGTLGGVITDYVGGLSSEVGSIEGGLPDDLALLPIEAVEEEQQATVAHGDAPTDFVDLQTWLDETEPPRNPRMTGEEEGSSADPVQTDFSNMLETFKRGVAENVDESDADSHYDLGVAYLEMGLVDEAIAQFQKTLRAEPDAERRVRAYESLGQGFMQRGEYQTALDSLRAAVSESDLADGKLIGVLYLLGYASEHLAAWRDAEAYYRRVFAADIHFRDVGERLRRAESMA